MRDLDKTVPGKFRQPGRQPHVDPLEDDIADQSEPSIRPKRSAMLRE